MYKVTHGRTKRYFDNLDDAFTCMNELLTARQKDEKRIPDQQTELQMFRRDLDPAYFRKGLTRTIGGAIKVGRYWLRIEEYDAPADGKAVADADLDKDLKMIADKKAAQDAMLAIEWFLGGMVGDRRRA
jgi:hypothetical protein